MKLYEITESLQKIEEKLNEELSESELKELFDEYLNSKEQLSVKVDNILALIKSLEGKSIVFNKEIKRLQSLKKGNDSTAKRLRNYLSSGLQTLEIDRITTDRFKCFLKEHSSILIEEEELPDKYCYYERIPNKTLINESLAEGKDIDGVYKIQDKILNIK